MPKYTFLHLVWSHDLRAKTDESRHKQLDTGRVSLEVLRNTARGEVCPYQLF